MATSISVSERVQHLVVFAGLFVLILVLKWPTLTQPPVWDGSMSVFPAAITLAENGFDLGYLLDQPGYLDGGPNVHSISLVTWLTAVVIVIVGDGPALFPVLHVIHFAIAAAAMTGIYRFALPLLGGWLALAATLTALVFPLTLTQAGYLYLEFPLLATAVFALLAWSRRDVGQSAVWASVAVLIKGSGLVVAGALALLAFVNPGSERRDVRTAAIMLFFPVSIAGGVVALIPGFDGPSLKDHWGLMATSLGLVPDLVVLLVSFLVFALALRPWHRSSAIEPIEHSAASDRSMTIAVFVSVFLGFYLSLPVFGISLIVIPRYYLLIVPFLIVGLSALARSRFSKAAVLVALLLMTAWFTVNRNGDFYLVNSINNFALAERSGAYRDLLELQQMGIQALLDLPPGVEVFYDQPAHYKLGYPLMGYADSELANGHSIRHEAPYREGRLNDFPPEFYMLYEFPWLGGETIKSIRDQAETDPNRTVALEELCVASFCSVLIHVSPAASS